MLIESTMGRDEGVGMLLKILLRKIRKLTRISLVYFLFVPTRVLLLLTRSNIQFSNNSHSKIDGAGAQIQRLLAVYSLSKKYRIKFHQNAFTDISVHPLDPFQTHESKEKFLVELNYLFALERSARSQTARVIEIGTLSAWRFFRIVASNFLRPDTIILNIVEPYPITDCFPDLFNDIVNCFPNWKKFASELAISYPKPLVSIHYRQGVGGSVIYPGQKIPRELPPSYFLSNLRNEFGEDGLIIPVQIFTDAPVADTIYEPNVMQRSHWEGTPGFTDGQMKIKGNDLFTFFNENQVPVHIQSGGNPLEAMAIMSKSDFLITSRSSLSFVAGLLNSEGRVLAAEGFWHPAPSEWLTN